MALIDDCISWCRAENNDASWQTPEIGTAWSKTGSPSDYALAKWNYGYRGSDASNYWSKYIGVWQSEFTWTFSIKVPQDYTSQMDIFGDTLGGYCAAYFYASQFWIGFFLPSTYPDGINMQFDLPSFSAGDTLDFAIIMDSSAVQKCRVFINKVERTLVTATKNTDWTDYSSGFNIALKPYNGVNPVILDNLKEFNRILTQSEIDFVADNEEFGAAVATRLRMRRIIN